MQKTTLTMCVAALLTGMLTGGCASDGEGTRDRVLRDAAALPEAVAVEEVVEQVALAAPTIIAAPPERAAQQFEMLKGLAGSWVASGAEGSAPGAQLRYDVTAAGSAVVETIFPGEEHEMVSVYTMNNGRLEMTHYCAMGNQPHFTSEAGTADGVIKLTCTGAGNTKSHADPHMHEGVLTVGDGTLHAEWTMYQNLERGGTVVIDLVRGDM